VAQSRFARKGVVALAAGLLVLIAAGLTVVSTGLGRGVGTSSTVQTVSAKLNCSSYDHGPTGKYDLNVIASCTASALGVNMGSVLKGDTAPFPTLTMDMNFACRDYWGFQQDDAMARCLIQQGL
jgi:hypothetical protein